MTRQRQTTLSAIRLPSEEERAEHGADVVFERIDRTTGRRETIYAAVCYESWQQWGATRDVLADNVPDVERWRHGRTGLPVPR